MTKLRTRKRLGKPNKLKAGLIGGGIALVVVLLAVVIVLALANSGEEGKKETETFNSLEETSQTTVTAQAGFSIDKESANKKQFGQHETLLGKGDEQYGEITYSFSYPKTSDEKLNQAVAEKTTAITSQFTQEARYSKRKNAEGKLTAQLEGDYEAYAANGRYGGIVFETARYLADTAEPEKSITAYAVDFVESRILSTEELFQEGGLQKVSEICKNAVQELVGEDMIADGLAPTADNYANIVFSKEAMRIYFNKYQAASGKHGMIQVCIPYTMLGDCLSIDMASSEIGAALSEEPPATESPRVTLITTPAAAASQAGKQKETAAAPVHSQSPVPHVTVLANEKPVQTAAQSSKAEKPKSTGKPDKTERKLVALTFDDGPHGEYTNQILDVLEKYDAKATFFVVGSRIRGREKILKRMDKLGCEVGNHTWSHADLTKLSKEQAEKEIENTSNAVKKAIGKGTSLVRPTYGARQGLKEYVKYPMILWSVDTEDWKTRDTEATIKEATKIKKSGNIILFHDMYSSTAEAVQKIVPALIDEGYELVTVSELFSAMGEKLEGGQIYRLA